MSVLSSWSFLTTKPSFVNRDMVMRHFGGGIGHAIHLQDDDESELDTDDDGYDSL